MYIQLGSTLVPDVKKNKTKQKKTGFVTLYKRQGSRPSPWEKNAKKQNGCLGRLTNSCEKKLNYKIPNYFEIIFPNIFGLAISLCCDL